MRHSQQQAAAAEFARRWAGRGDEKSDTQTFWLDLLESVYGVKLPGELIRFENRVLNESGESTNYIDAKIPETKVLIEQKSLGKDLSKAVQQSDGTWLRTEQQAKRYSDNLNYDERPRWIVTCNFGEFRVYDMNVLPTAW